MVPPGGVNGQPLLVAFQIADLTKGDAEGLLAHPEGKRLVQVGRQLQGLGHAGGELFVIERLCQKVDGPHVKELHGILRMGGDVEHLSGVVSQLLPQKSAHGHAVLVLELDVQDQQKVGLSGTQTVQQHLAAGKFHNGERLPAGMGRENTNDLGPNGLLVITYGNLIHSGASFPRDSSTPDLYWSPPVCGSLSR